MESTTQHRGFSITARALGEGPKVGGAYEARPLDLLAEGPHFVGETTATFADEHAAINAAMVDAKAAIDRALGTA